MQLWTVLSLYSHNSMIKVFLPKNIRNPYQRSFEERGFIPSYYLKREAVKIHIWQFQKQTEKIKGEKPVFHKGSFLSKIWLFISSVKKPHKWENGHKNLEWNHYALNVSVYAVYIFIANLHLDFHDMTFHMYV